jgi:hypothetical protein
MVITADSDNDGHGNFQLAAGSVLTSNNNDIDVCFPAHNTPVRLQRAHDCLAIYSHFTLCTMAVDSSKHHRAGRYRNGHTCRRCRHLYCREVHFLFTHVVLDGQCVSCAAKAS